MPEGDVHSRLPLIKINYKYISILFLNQLVVTLCPVKGEG